MGGDWAQMLVAEYHEDDSAQIVRSFRDHYLNWIIPKIAIISHLFSKWVKFIPFPAKFIYSNFQPLEVVSDYRNPQLQVSKNYSYLFSFSLHICMS